MKKTFKEQLKRLEEIAEILEDGNCDLEKAMELYEEGILISRECNEKLNEARQKITTFNGEE